MPVVRLSSESQIAIPAELCNEFGIGPGDEVMLEMRGNSIVITRTPSTALARLRALGGTTWDGAADRLERDRDDWER